jgi:acyl carrier protein
MITESEVRQLLMTVGVSPVTAEGDLDVSFEELGLDSLARIEIASRVLDRFGVEVEEQLTSQETPAGMRRLVNEKLTAVTAGEEV